MPDSVEQVAPRVVVALGARAVLGGFPLAGARLIPAENDDEVRAGWRALPEGTAVVILSSAAAVILDAELDDIHGPMTVVLPS